MRMFPLQEELCSHCGRHLNCNQNRGCNPKVVGGIVVKYNSVFYYYDKLEYHDFKENSEDWKTFDELLREITLTN